MKSSIQAEIETTLAHLVSIPSVSSNAVACREIIEYVRNQLEPLNFFIISDTQRDNPWLLATTQDTKEPDILLASHLDVVPGGLDLFTIKKQDGKLIGRGVYDMKFAAACYLVLAKNHAHELKKLNIGFLFTTDEELNGACMPGILEMGLKPGIVFIPDGGDNWHVEERAKGIYSLEVIARGTTAHGSRPWEGDNALHRIMDVLNKLREIFPHEHPDTATLAVTQVTGGIAINQIADFASAKIDFRSFHRDDIQFLRSELERLASEHDLEIVPINDGDPLLFNKDAPASQRFLKVLESITGKPTQYISSFGASDARYFAQYDIPCVIIEPYGGGRHASDEWILASDLAKYYSLLEKWVLEPNTIAALSDHNTILQAV